MVLSSCSSPYPSRHKFSPILFTEALKMHFCPLPGRRFFAKSPKYFFGAGGSGVGVERWSGICYKNYNFVSTIGGVSFVSTIGGVRNPLL